MNVSPHPNKECLNGFNQYNSSVHNNAGPDSTPNVFLSPLPTGAGSLSRIYR